MAEVVVPEVGESGMEVTFVRWLRAEGDLVEEGETLFELDTAKAIMEVQAFTSGRLVDLRASEGDIVEPHQVVARIEAVGESGVAAAQGTTDGAGSAVTGSERAAVSVSPKARRLATERGVDLSVIRGSGPDGMITERDVLAAAAGGPATAAPPAGPAADSARERVRRLVADRTLESWQTIPHFALRLEADVTAGLARSKPMALVAHAVVTSLAAHPECNLRWQSDELVRREAVDLGILVDTPSGLLLGGVRNAQRLDISDLEAAIREAAERARNGLIGTDDAGLHSITLSNLGMFAVDEFSGIIPRGDVMLLAFGRVRSVARWSGDEPVRREVVTLTLTVDHRALSGADAARFLTTLETRLAGQPEGDR